MSAGEKVKMKQNKMYYLLKTNSILTFFITFSTY